MSAKQRSEGNRWRLEGTQVRGVGRSKSKNSLGIIFCPKVMILQGVGHQIPYLGVCYANDPKKWGGYMALAPALDITTSLRGDFCRPLLAIVVPCRHSFTIHPHCSTLSTPLTLKWRSRQFTAQSTNNRIHEPPLTRVPTASQWHNRHCQHSILLGTQRQRWATTVLAKTLFFV